MKIIWASFRFGNICIHFLSNALCDYASRLFSVGGDFLQHSYDESAVVESCALAESDAAPAFLDVDVAYVAHEWRHDSAAAAEPQRDFLEAAVSPGSGAKIPEDADYCRPYIWFIHRPFHESSVPEQNETQTLTIL